MSLVTPSTMTIGSLLKVIEEAPRIRKRGALPETVLFVATLRPVTFPLRASPTEETGAA